MLSRAASRPAAQGQCAPVSLSRRIGSIALALVLIATAVGAVAQPDWSSLMRHILAPQTTTSQIIKPAFAADYQYKTTIKGDSPSAYWPMDDGSGSTAADATGNGHGMSFNYNLHWYGSGMVAGSGSAIQGDCDTCHNAWLSTSSPVGLPAARTLEIWFQCVPAHQCSWETHLMTAHGTGTCASMRLIIVNTSRVNADDCGNVSNCDYAGTTGVPDINDGLAHLFDASSDGTSMHMYIDGVSCVDGGGTASGVAITGADCTTVGADCGAGGPYSVYHETVIGQAAVYPVGLTSSQVTNHFNAAGFFPGAVTNLVPAASTNSASLTWTPPSYAGTTPISSYTVTPIVDGRSSTPMSVMGAGTGANVPNLPGGASYTFQVQAVNARGAGSAVTSNAVTIGSPAAGQGSFGTYLYMRGGQGNGQAWSHYGIVSRNNVPALSTWTLEARLWGWQSLSITGSHMAFGFLSGSTSNPSDQNPVAGLNFNIGGSPLQTYFVWPGGGSCAINSDTSGIPSAFNISVTTPAHIALTYDGTTVRGFINGSQVCSQASSSASLAAGPFGFMDNAGLAQGYFDEIRVSSVARYTANFTPPTQQFATDSSTNVLWHFNDYQISKLPSIHIQPGPPGLTLVPSTYRDFSGNLNHANTVWGTGSSSGPGDDWRRPYSLGQGVTADELVGGVSPWLCPCTANGGDPINLATGEFWDTIADFNIPGRVPLAFNRTYSSLRVGSPLQPTKFGSVGFGWTYNYAEYLSFSGANGTGNATVHAVNGSAVVFTFNSQNSTYAPPPSEHVSLVRNGDNTFTLTDRTLNQTVFNVAVNDPGGATSTSTLSKFVDRHNYQTVLTPNADGTIQKVTDPAGRTLTFSYTTIGSDTFVATITDGVARQIVFTYGTNASDATTYQSLIQVQDVAGGLTHFTYDSGHYLQTVTDPRGGVTTNTYDPTSHRVTSQSDPLNRQTTFTYSGGVTTVTDPLRHQFQDEYLNNIRMSRTIGTGTQAVTTTYSYDPSVLGQTAASGALGQAATATRDANDNPISTTDSMGRSSTRTYNSFNETMTDQDPLLVATTTTYNVTGDVASVSRPLVGTQQIQITTFSFGDAQHPGDVTSMTDGDGQSWTYGYDAYGNRASVTDPAGDKTTFVFDSVSRMTSLVTPNGNVQGGNPANFTWSYTVDAFGNRLTATDPLTHQVTYHYDANQNLDRITDADGNLTTIVYDADNEATQQKRADNPQTTLTTDYNSDGTVLDQKDGKGNPILTFGYNALAQRTTVTDALGNTTTYSYDAAGNVVTKQDAGGNCAAAPPTGCTTYGYDSANQLISAKYSDGTTPNISNIRYDAAGNRIAAADGTGSSSWSWDSLGRLVAYTNGNGTQVQWAYNLRNLPTTITYPGSLSVTEGYDNAGRWTSTQDWNSNTTAFGYDADSNLITETFPAASGVVDTVTFNNADRVTAVASKKGSTTLFSATYSRDSANQLASDSSAASGTGSYKYNPLNQLCYAGSNNTNACASPPTGSTAYSYDAADNLTQNGTTQQAFNNSDEICWTATTTGPCSTPPSGASTYQFDVRGNRTVFNPNGAQTQTLAYDQANRLSSFTVGGNVTSYGYNADGTRMCKISGASTTPCTSPSANQFVWDPVGGGVVLQDGSTRYVYGPHGLPLEQVSGTTTYYFHHDQLGSTRLVNDQRWRKPSHVHV